MRVSDADSCNAKRITVRDPMEYAYTLTIVISSVLSVDEGTSLCIERQELPFSFFR